MTIDERKQCFFGWLYKVGWWTREQIIEKFNANLDGAVAEAVATKEAELMQVQTALGHAESDMKELQAELAALRVPAGPVTMEEARIIGDAWYSVPGMGEDAEKAICVAVDKLIAPRVAQAVAAEREKHAKAKLPEEVEKELAQQADEDARTIVKKGMGTNSVNGWQLGRLRTAAHMAVLAEQTQLNSEWWAKWEKASKELIGQERERHAAELAAADQRWQERMKAVEAEVATVKRQNENTIHYWQNSTKAADGALATEKANWKAHLERVESEHAKAVQEVKANVRDKIQKGSWRVVELTIQGAEKRFTERMAKAVAEAYEEAAKICGRGSYGGAGYICEHGADYAAILRAFANEIRQLAAKPQESAFNPDGMFTTTRTDNHGNPLAPKFPDCECGLTEAHDAPPAAKKPETCFTCGDEINPDNHWAGHGRVYCSEQHLRAVMGKAKSPGQAIASAVEAMILKNADSACSVCGRKELHADCRATMRSSGRIFVIDVAGVG